MGIGLVAASRRCSEAVCLVSVLVLPRSRSGQVGVRDIRSRRSARFVRETVNCFCFKLCRLDACNRRSGSEWARWSRLGGTQVVGWIPCDCVQ
jgi:hypothetical protein